MIGLIVISAIVGAFTGVGTIHIFPDKWLAAVLFGIAAFITVLASLEGISQIYDHIWEIEDRLPKPPKK